MAVAAAAGDAGLVPLRAGNFELAWDAARAQLVITVGCSRDLLKAAHPSGSGKSRILASTSGFVTVPVDGIDGLKLSLTATLPA